MKTKIVADSAADLYVLDGVDFQSVPLTIHTDEKEYVDDANLDVFQMVDDLSRYKGKSGSACPSVGAWIEAFGDAEEVYCVTIISTLSGSYNSALTAKKQYEEENPGRKVYVVDSFSTGPGMKLLVDKLRDFVKEKLSFEVICEKIEEYKKSTKLLFCLESLKNLANNGRVSMPVAKIAGLLGIRIVGKPSDEGQIEPTDKCRGENKALKSIIENMKKQGYRGKQVIIDHCFNEKAAISLKDMIKNEFKEAMIRIERTAALCSFYAEKGGLIVGFEV